MGTIFLMQANREWLTSVTNGDSLHEVDRKTGLDNSGMARKFRQGKTLSAEQVIAVARGYNLDPVQALRDTGFLPQNPAEETPEQLAERIKADVDRLASKIQESNVIPIHAENAPDVAQDHYSYEQLGAVAYGDDEDAERGWEGDFD